MKGVQLVHGDCLEVLPTLEAGSIDAVITDPPYAEVDRAYGRLSEADWHVLMDGVVAECRRILKPTGSAVFILQPNSKHVGEMRLWLWEFLLRTAKSWNLVQDAYWWNVACLPLVGAPYAGLMRPSVKYCLWFGPPDCYRNQEEVLWEESDRNRAQRVAGRCDYRKHPGGNKVRGDRIVANERDGVTPFNVLPIPTGDNTSAKGHPAQTPMRVCSWWVRYLCPPGGTVLDPFVGSGTVAVACNETGRNCIGIEKNAEYVASAQKRIAEATPPLFREAVTA